MTAITRNLYIDRLDEIFDKYNKTFHTAIKMKPADVNVDTYIDYGVEHNNKDSSFKVDVHVRMSKYKNVFA